jgi:glycerol kinase
MAGLSSGLWKDLDALSAMWREERGFEPQMPRERRERLYEGWQVAVASTRGWAKKVTLDQPREETQV